MTTGIETALIGRVGGEPQLRTSAAGKQWLSLSLAVDNGEEQPQWVQVAIFGDRALELAGIEKGSKLYIEGRLTLRTWQQAERPALALGCSVESRATRPDRSPQSKTSSP
jgi:single-stranded DNA-binding protein